jgi:hypothetical protein
MLNTLRIETVRTAGLKATLATLMLLGSGASMAANFELCATTGSVTMPGTNQVVTVLGYAAGACSGSVTSPGGPVLVATVGEVVAVKLHNGLAEATGLVFQGQAMPPDLTGTPNGVDKDYTFTATNPGTYLYQAAPLNNAEHQTAMGLYGALIVRPAGAAAPFSRTDANVTTTLDSAVVVDAAALASDVGATVSGPGIAPGTTILSVNAGVDMTLSAAATADGAGVSLALSRTSGQAYAAATTAFDEESTLVLSELDPALNNSATPAAFDMRDYAPKYFLINGKAFPETLPIGSAVGHKLLLRYVNAGSQHHSMAALGLRQNFIAKDGKVLPTADVAVTAETLAPGQTGDALIVMPAALTAPSQFAVYDGNLKLHNSSDQKIGGMLTFVTADGSAATAGPVTTGAKFSLNPTGGTADDILTATISTTAAGGVIAAEYFIDVPCKNGAGGIDMAASGASPLSVSATINVATLASLSSGNHTFYVHGQDANGWGACTSVVLNLDKTGPATSALTLTPNPSNGSVAVALKGTASDVASGGATIQAFQYWVDANAPTTVTLTGAAATVRSLSASLPAPGTVLPTHTVSVQSQDALGNWGPVATITLTVTTSGPVTSALSLRPGSANNGSYGVSSGQPVVRVLGTETSGAAKVTAAEGFIDGACPANGTRGFPFTPVDGAWGGATERVSADIPLGTINNLSAGSHPVWVRGKDSTGAWGACVSTPLLIDKAAPTLTSGSISPAAVPFGTATATLNFVAADTGGAGVAGVQYWFDSATAPANPKVAAGTTSATLSLAGLAGGNHTAYFRARDAANNVSAPRNTPLTIVQAVNDARNIIANTGTTQTSDTSTAQRVLANDLPTGGTPRTAVLLSAPVRTSGTGAGTLTLSCFAGAGNTAGTPVSGNTICTNGAYRATLTGVGATANARAASKRGTFQFTYQMNRAGALSNVATVTIRVQ